MIEMIRRQKAAEATKKRFLGKPFAYGKNDCVRMAVFALRQMGHRPRLGKAGTYKSAMGAMRALKRAGYASLAEALDGLGLPRIAPAAALPADIIMVPGEEPFDGALHIVMSNGRTLAYHEDVVGAEILQPTEYIAAWRT